MLLDFSAHLSHYGAVKIVDVAVNRDCCRLVRPQRSRRHFHRELRGFTQSEFRRQGKPLLAEQEPLPRLDDAAEQALDSLQQVGLGTKKNTLVDLLSGGEQQRVSIARAYAVKPKILFADEPTGNLDAATGHQIADLMFSLRDQAGTTLVLVTHETELAQRGDRQILIESGRLQDQR